MVAPVANCLGQLVVKRIAATAAVCRYDYPEIWFLENGVSEKGEAQRNGAARFKDPFRIKYFKGYIEATCR